MLPLQSRKRPRVPAVAMPEDAQNLVNEISSQLQQQELPRLEVAGLIQLLHSKPWSEFHIEVDNRVFEFLPCGLYFFPRPLRRICVEKLKTNVEANVLKVQRKLHHAL